MNKSLIIFIFFLIYIKIDAQKIVVKDVIHNCATHKIMEQLNSVNNEFSEFRLQMDEEILSETLKDKSVLKESDDIITIPVVFHIIHPNGTPIGEGSNLSNERIYLAIQHLNDAFSNSGQFYFPEGHDTGFRFCLATLNESGGLSSGINRFSSNTYSEIQIQTEEPGIKQNTVRWDANKYLNVWVVENICYDDNCGISGYSYQAEVHGTIYDGIVIEADNVGGNLQLSKLLFHEVGHYLDLLHPFEDGCKNNNCLADNDKVCDTPPENSQFAYDCDSSPNTCSTDANDLTSQNPFRPISFGGLGDQPDLINNYMDYGYLNCRTSFTLGQIQRMRISFDLHRTSLLSSNVCDLEDNVTIDIDFCNPPQFSQVNYVTDATLSLGWSEITTADSYSIKIREIGTNNEFEVIATETQKIIGNLSPNTNYVYTINSICGTNTSLSSITGYFTTLPLSNTCDTPLNISYNNLGTNNVLISWGAVSGAINYTVFRKKGNEPWAEFTSEINSIFFNNLEPNTTYFVKVRANCGNGIYSEETNTINFTTNELVVQNCFPPTGVEINYIVSNSAFISWNDVPDADNYIIGYKKLSDVNYNYKTTENKQITLSGLEPNTTYQVTVSSQCEDETVQSNQIYSFTTTIEEELPECPIPTNLQTQNITTNSATFTWNTINDADAYVVFVRELNGSWTPYNANNNFYTINTLQAGKIYQFRVYAICNGVSGDYSSITTFSTEMEVVECVQPNSVNVNVMSESNVLVSWSAIENATSYNISIRKFGTSNWNHNTISNNSFMFSNLEAATSYVFILSTNCDDIESGAYYTGSFLTDNAPIQETCNTPSNFNLGNTSSNSASFTWANIDNADNYFVYIRQENQNWESRSTPSNQITINNLLPSTNYEARVSASCSGISSSFSNIIAFTTNVNTPPPSQSNCPPPTGLFVTNATTTTLTANWNQLPEASFYIIGITESDNENGWEYQIVGNELYTFTNLQPNTPYAIKIRSMCGSFAGEFTNLYTASTLSSNGSSNTNEDNGSTPNDNTATEEGCNFPSGISVNNISDESATIYWNEVTKADKYILFLKRENQTIPDIEYVEGTEKELTNLIPNSIYEIRLKSICDDGISLNSPVITFETTESASPTQVICGTPSGLNLISMGDNMLQFNWNEQENAVFYQAELYTNNELTKTVTVSGSMATFSDININGNLKVRVRSYCGNLWSAYSEFMTITTTNENPGCGKVNGLLTSNIEETTATLSWQVIPGANEYEIQLWVEGTTVIANYTINTNFRNVSLLNQCVNYEWKVRAVCDGIKGEFSEVQKFTTACSLNVCGAEGQSTITGFISQVKIGDDGKISGNDNGYGNYTNNQFTLNSGSSNTFEMKSSSENGFFWGVWIDKNKDGIFDKFLERVYLSTTPRYGTCAGFITISPDAEEQITTMRVIMSTDSDIDPCEDYDSGETEDYSIKIEN